MSESVLHAEEYELPERPEDGASPSKLDLDDDDHEDARLLGLEGKPSSEDRLSNEGSGFYRWGENENATGTDSNIEALIARVSFRLMQSLHRSSNGSSDCAKYR